MENQSITSINKDNQTSLNIPKILQDRDEAIDDRDRLLKIIDRKNSEIERLESDIKILKNQHKSAVDAKCMAITKCDEIQSKMTQIEFKERRFDQERIIMENQIQTLTNDLDRNIQELQNLRKETTTQILTLEAKVHEKTEELGIVGRQLGQMKEVNAGLTMQVEDLSQKLLKHNEDFTATMQKYHQELKSKTRLSELYKEKSEEVLNGHQDITSVVTELKQALNEATEEYGKLEINFKQSQVKNEELINKIESLQNEVKNSRQENIEKSIEKFLSPSAMMKLSGKSVTEIFTLYIKTLEEFEALKDENLELMQNFTELVNEIKEKGPQIQRNQVEVEKLKIDNENLKFKFEKLLREKFLMQKELEVMINEVQSLRRDLLNCEEDKKDLRTQICRLIADESDFTNVEELYDNNLKLVDLIKELSSEIEKLKVENPQKIITTHFKTATVQTEPNNDELNSLKSKFDAIQSNHNQLDELRSQNSEFKVTNFKLQSQLEHQEGQLKLQQKNFEALKQTSQNLTERLQTLSTTNTKLETILQNLNVELKNSESELRNLRRKNENLSRENQNFIKNEAKLKAESEVFQRQSQLQSHMMSNLEFIKASIERGEKNFEEKIQEISNENQIKIDKITKERDELQKKFEEAKEKFKKFVDKANESLAERDEEMTQLHHALTKAYEDLEKFNVAKKDCETQVDLIESESFISCTNSNLLDETMVGDMSVDENVFKCSKKRNRDEEEVEENCEEKRLKISGIEGFVGIGQKCRYHDW